MAYAVMVSSRLVGRAGYGEEPGRWGGVGAITSDVRGPGRRGVRVRRSYAGLHSPMQLLETPRNRWFAYSEAPVATA